MDSSDRLLPKMNTQEAKDIVATAAAFKYKKFNDYDDALQWYRDKESFFSTSDESLISFAKEASDPFQFMAKALTEERYDLQVTPINQDASASAYQIMSYLLLNEDMAKRTNLLPCPDGKIQDLYSLLLDDFKLFLHSKIENKVLLNIIETCLDRKLVKRLFMLSIAPKEKKKLWEADEREMD